MKAYANTAHLDHAPYVREIVDTFPAPVRGATFMSLQPGIESIRHVDAKLGFPWGAVRLHIPVVTNSSATTLIDDEEVHWDEGELWWGNYALPHLIRNAGAEARTHLVIDSYITEDLIRWFPAHMQSRLAGPEVLLWRPLAALTDGRLYERQCDVPRSYLSWGEAFGALFRRQPLEAVAIKSHGAWLTLSTRGEERFRLNYIGDHEFRFEGWSDERTICFPPTVGRVAATLIVRQGRDRIERDVPVHASSRA